MIFRSHFEPIWPLNMTFVYLIQCILIDSPWMLEDKSELSSVIENNFKMSLSLQKQITMCWQLRGYNGSLWGKCTIATKASIVSGFLSARCFVCFYKLSDYLLFTPNECIECASSKYAFDHQIIYKSHTSSCHKKTSKKLSFNDHHMQECALHTLVFVVRMLETRFTFQMLFYFIFCLWNAANITLAV